jgi:hypothetical protein
MGSAKTPENVSTDFSLMLIDSFFLFVRNPYHPPTVHSRNGTPSFTSSA